MRTARRALGVMALVALGGACTFGSLSGLSGGEGPSDGGAADAQAGADGTAPRDGSVLGPDGAAPDAGDGGFMSPYAQVVLQDKPVLYYRLGESSNTGVARDLASGKNATFNGNIVTGVPGAIAGDPDTACSFDGANDFIALAAGPAFAGTLSYSIEAWARPSSVMGPTARVVAGCDQEPNDGYALFFFTSLEPRVERETDASIAAITSTSAVGFGVYAHLVGTYDGTTQRLYVDGVLTATGTNTDPIPGTSNAPFEIGANSRNGLNNRFAGDIDEVALYDRVLPAASVKLHHDVGRGLVTP